LVQVEAVADSGTVVELWEIADTKEVEDESLVAEYEPPVVANVGDAAEDLRTGGIIQW
jgi:hypothetical protein